MSKNGAPEDQQPANVSPDTKQPSLANVSLFGGGSDSTPLLPPSMVWFEYHKLKSGGIWKLQPTPDKTERAKKIMNATDRSKAQEMEPSQKQGFTTLVKKSFHDILKTKESSQTQKAKSTRQASTQGVGTRFVATIGRRQCKCY